MFHYLKSFHFAQDWFSHWFSVGREELWAQNHIKNDDKNTPMVSSSINIDKLHIDLSRICETSRVLCQEIKVLAEIDTFFCQYKRMYKLYMYIYICVLN